jgi:hypothetical protein
MREGAEAADWVSKHYLLDATFRVLRILLDCMHPRIANGRGG